MKTEHEKLKYICDKIGYESKIEYGQHLIDLGIEDSFFGEYTSKSDYKEREIDVREIIFTKNFIDKYINYMLNKNIDLLDITFGDDLLEHLDNPIDYLYNLIK